MECCEERLFKESQTAYVRRTDYPVIIPKNTIGKVKEEAAFLEVWMEKEAEDEVCRLFVDYCRQALVEKERSFQQAKKRYEGTLEHFYTETSISNMNNVNAVKCNKDAGKAHYCKLFSRTSKMVLLTR